jgi:casein kinase II subunit beta
MSRPPQSASEDASQAELEEEEEVISGTGEGDEVMGEVEEQGYTSSTPTSTLTWISWFCSLPGHEYFCEVSEDFIEDDFNLTGLNSMVPFWKEAMEMVLDVEPDEDSSKIPDVSIVEASAELLYGLVHQRYILTRAGLQAMVEKYEAGMFGNCPRVYCVGCNVVPCGRSDLPGLDTVKLFCPNCNDIYVPPSSRFQGVDGAFFGTTFGHLFFQSYRELAPAPFFKSSSSTSSPMSPGRSPRSASGSSASHQPPFVNPNPHGGQKRAAGHVYVPRIYGFKVSEKAKCGPRMQWLRMRPEHPEDLELVDWRGRWIDDDDEYDDEEGEEEGEDRRMEDFDPDAVEEEDDEEEEEEEEEASNAQMQQLGKRQHAIAVNGRSALRPPTPIHPPSPSARTSPASTAPPQTPRDLSIADSVSVGPLRSYCSIGKVRVIKQWTRDSDAAWATAKV